MTQASLEKAKRTIRWHSRWWMEKGRQMRGLQNEFSEQYNLYADVLAKAFEDEICPICNRSYTSMAEDKKGCVANPLWHKTLHIWVSDWIVVCRRCHPTLEGKMIPRAIEALSNSSQTLLPLDEFAATLGEGRCGGTLFRTPGAV
jgi:hypothetical protein